MTINAKRAEEPAGAADIELVDSAGRQVGTTATGGLA
jgi:hypothetical protein